MTHPFWENETDADYTPQAEIDSQDMEAVLRAFQLTGVVSGCAVAETSTPAQTIDVASGYVAHDGLVTAYAGATGQSVTAADSTNPRIDAVSISSAGSLVVTAGTAAATDSVVAPAWPAGNVPLAWLYVPASDNTHHDEQISDKRCIVNASAGCYMEHVLGSTTASIAVASIPAVSQDLEIVAELKTDSTADVSDGANMRFNDDSGSNYIYLSYYHSSSGSAGTITSVSATTGIRLGIIEGNHSGGNANAFALVEGVIGGYTATDHFRICGGDASQLDSSTPFGYRSIWSGQWLNAANAITKISLHPNTGSNFLAESSLRVYFKG